MAERQPGYASDPDTEAREGEVREGEVREGETREGELPDAPLTEKQRKLNELEGYYGKVLGDLDREHREADAVHDAAEKRMAQVEVQKTQVDAEYAERKAAIEAEAEPEATAQKPPTRWGSPTVIVVKKPEPEPEPQRQLESSYPERQQEPSYSR